MAIARHRHTPGVARTPITRDPEWRQRRIAGQSETMNTNIWNQGADLPTIEAGMNNRPRAPGRD
jgi:hypothetical protein